jgi:hypothetical protein
MSAVLAVASLFVFVALMPVVGVGVLFAPFVLGLFLLALIGVLAGLEDQTVRQRGGVLDDPRRWRNGS